MGLNTLVSRNFTDYVQTFRVAGEWREHDVDEYTKGRVPDNSMMLQVAMRAALDKMKNLTTFAYVPALNRGIDPLLMRTVGSSTPSRSRPFTRVCSRSLP